MAMHSLELPRSSNERAKQKAQERGISLESLITGLVEEYGNETYDPIKPAERGEVMRVKLGVSDDDWAQARRHAKETDTNLTSAIVRRIEEL